MSTNTEAINSYKLAEIGAVRMGFGKKLALVIIDMQNDLVGPWTEECITHNKILLAVARESGIPIFFIRALLHPTKTAIGLSTWKPRREGRVIVEGTRGAEIIDELSPRNGEFVIHKRRVSAFFGTDLEIFLRSLQIDTLIVTGVTTSGCVRCSITDAFVRDYRVIVPRECVAEQSKTVHENNLFDINAKYGEVMPLKQVIDFLQRLTVKAE